MRREEKLNWFKQARFGLFIHWGLYAITARDMWYYSWEEVEKERYEALFDRFDPVDYNPREWAKVAKQAGMKYAVFTTKHHDGFCLWDTKYTDFKVTRTPFGRDILREWVDAFRAEGIRLGFYHSLFDWHHPHFLIDYNHPQRAMADELNKGRDYTIYLQYLHNQVRELLTEYGKIDIMWFDYSYGPQPGTGLPGKSGEDWRACELHDMVKRLQPDIIINNRLELTEQHANDAMRKDRMYGDFATPEQLIPGEDLADGESRLMWETCETIDSSWGYCRGDTTTKPPGQVIRHLVSCTGNNGNLLLNVGPTARGLLPGPAVKTLMEVGKWLRINGESIYGAGHSVYHAEKWCPRLEPLFTQRGRSIYIHFPGETLPSYPLVLAALPAKAEYIEMVADKSCVDFDYIKVDNENRLRIFTPAGAQTAYNTVMRVILEDE